MPTANQEVRMCKCGDSEAVHTRIVTDVELVNDRPTVHSRQDGCTVCPCTGFREQRPVHLREGEQLRRFTED